MRSKKLAATVITVVAAGATVATAASGAGTGADPVTYTAKPTGGVPLDLGRKGVSPGDQFLEHGTLADTDGHAAGRFQMVTQLVSGNARRGSEQSSITLYLAGGQIEVSGGHATAAHFTMPVVGGTGSYAGAAGTLGVAPGRGEAEALTLELR